jgi:hypothetical protein
MPREAHPETLGRTLSQLAMGQLIHPALPKGGPYDTKQASMIFPTISPIEEEMAIRGDSRLSVLLLPNGSA